jgi:hypothetical protein
MLKRSYSIFKIKLIELITSFFVPVGCPNRSEDCVPEGSMQKLRGHDPQRERLRGEASFCQKGCLEVRLGHCPRRSVS